MRLWSTFLFLSLFLCNDVLVLSCFSPFLGFAVSRVVLSAGGPYPLPHLIFRYLPHVQLDGGVACTLSWITPSTYTLIGMVKSPILSVSAGYEFNWRLKASR